MSGMRSRRKGKSGELDLCRVLGDAGFPARRGVQYQGGPDSPDVVCESLPGIHFECKRTERLDLYGALMQASSEAGRDQVPVVAHRRNESEWVAILRLEDFLAILAESGEVSHEAMPGDDDVEETTVGAALAAIGGEIESVEVVK